MSWRFHVVSWISSDGFHLGNTFILTWAYTQHVHASNFPTLFADADYVKLLLWLVAGEIRLLQQWLTVTDQIGCHYTVINKQTSICILLLLLPECLTGITMVVFTVLPWIYNELRIIISFVFVLC